MNADARISTGLPGHPKTKKLIKRVGEAGAWSLVCLFLWAASNRTDGDLSGMSDEDIELAAGWGGQDGELVRSLVEVRFLEGVESTYQIHDWAEHNPWAAGADARSAKARWNAAKRHHGAAEADRLVPEYAAIRIASSNASSPDVLDRSNAPSPSPSPSPKAKAKERTTPSAAPTALPEVPDWVPADAWAGFVAMRRHERHSLTPRAAKLVLAELGRLRDAGADPGAVLDQSTRQGWRDVFPLREQKLRAVGGSGYQPLPGEV